MAVRVAAIMLVAAAPAIGADRVTLRIPTGPLDRAIIALGAQANITIGMTDGDLGDVHVTGIDGRFAVNAALRRLLAGTRADFVRVGPGVFRIVRRTLPPRSKAVAARVPQVDPAAAIIVTGSKRGLWLSDYPGSATVMLATDPPSAAMIHGSESLVGRAPILSATHLGPGRDKIFVRGIADSSFAGPTQATVGQYLGEVRLTYNAPDPDLALYDIRSIEVLEGPQGTLYGAGALGGIIRLVPEPPDLSMRSGAIWAGGTLTAHGAPGWDAAGLVNLPLVRGRAGIRAIAYTSIDGGYIDDPLRGLRDINRTVTRGGRATLRATPGADWKIDLGGIVQDINSRDGNYTDRRLPPLSRASVIAQPFDNDYGLLSLVVRHDGASTSFISASSLVAHDLTSTYDASPSPAAPSAYVSLNRIRIFTNESRLSRTTADNGSWVVGLELLSSVDRLSHALGPRREPAAIGGARNNVSEASLYGEITVPLDRRLALTGGGRVAYSRITGEVLDLATDGVEPHRHALVLLPSFGLRWLLPHRLTLYARYQEGFRPGGLSVSSTAVQRFEADSLGTWEIGARIGTPTSRLEATVAASYARWQDIQADLIDEAGLPYTDNIGSGRVLGLEARANWRPSRRLAIGAALFANDGRLSRPAAAFAGVAEPTLPNIPDVTGRLDVRYDADLGGRAVRLSASASYTGRSRLGVGPILSIDQGGYADLDAGIAMPIGQATLSLDATNLLDTRRNIFALGNPFTVAEGWQSTPLRPRTIRLGIAFKL